MFIVAFWKCCRNQHLCSRFEYIAHILHTLTEVHVLNDISHVHQIKRLFCPIRRVAKLREGTLSCVPEHELLVAEMFKAPSIELKDCLRYVQSNITGQRICLITVKNPVYVSARDVQKRLCTEFSCNIYYELKRIFSSYSSLPEPDADLFLDKWGGQWAYE